MTYLEIKMNEIEIKLKLILLSLKKQQKQIKKHHGNFFLFKLLIIIK